MLEGFNIHRETIMVYMLLNHTIFKEGEMLMKERLFKGTSWDKVNQKWRAVIHLDKKMIVLGLFDNRHDAAKAFVEATIQYGKEHYLSEINPRTEVTKLYRKRNKEKLNEKIRNKRAKDSTKEREAAKKLRLKTKKEVLEAYGNKCVCCGESNHEFLTIDHINNDGAKHRKEQNLHGGFSIHAWLKRNNFPKDNFQILCWNCNCAKGHYGYCPHENRKYEG